MSASLLIGRIRTKQAKVATVGLGYVGLPLAVEQAKAGFSVVGIERSRRRVDQVNRGENYISDVDPAELERLVQSGRLRATEAYSAARDADVITICVPTPLDRNKQPDMSYIHSAVAELLPHLHAGQLIVLESTTYPGTTEELIQPELEKKGFVVGKDVFLAFSPERVDPGNAKFKTRNTPKVVGGVTPACTEVAATLYETILEGGVSRVSSPRAAEMTKLLENIFRIVNISLVNELALLCERMGIDIWEVIEAAKTKPFGFMPFYPGPGVGGHCIPLDPFYLSWKAKEYDFSTRFIDLAGDISQAMPYSVVQLVAEFLGENGITLRGAKVLLLGVAYKAGISDTRESPALKIAELLSRRGARVSFHDPYVSSLELETGMLPCSPLTGEVLAQHDMVLITTAHESIDYESVVRQSRLVFDTRNATKRICSATIRRLGAPRWCSAQGR
jgi:UDP-N-acetyl-D-glucosamine dehydrogenase